MFDFNHTIVYNSEIMKTKLSLGPDTEKPLDIMMILSTVTVSVGFFANLTVVFVFVKHRKLRRKISNIFFYKSGKSPATLFIKYIDKKFKLFTIFSYFFFFAKSHRSTMENAVKLPQRMFKRDNCPKLIFSSLLSL